jgi:ABC-type cobalamin transport system permease subunit
LAITEANAVPSFITTALLATVTGGTTAVTLLWQVARVLFGTGANTPWVPFLCAMTGGTCIYLVRVKDQNVKLSTRESVSGVFIAFLNSVALFSAALGISSFQAQERPHPQLSAVSPTD